MLFNVTLLKWMSSIYAWTHTLPSFPALCVSECDPSSTFHQCSFGWLAFYTHTTCFEICERFMCLNIVSNSRWRVGWALSYVLRPKFLLHLFMSFFFFFISACRWSWRSCHACVEELKDHPLNRVCITWLWHFSRASGSSAIVSKWAQVSV